MSEKHSTICHAISWSRDGPKLWSRAIQCGCLSRFAFSRSCPIAAPNKDLPGGSHFSKLLNLLNHPPHLPLFTPLTSSQLHRTHSHICSLQRLFQINLAYIQPWMERQAIGYWLALDKILYLKLLVFRKKTNKTSPVATRNSLCTCLSFLSLDGDELIFLLSE